MSDAGDSPEIDSLLVGKKIYKSRYVKPGHVIVIDQKDEVRPWPENWKTMTPDEKIAWALKEDMTIIIPEDRRKW